MSEVVRIGPRVVESVSVQDQRPSGVTLAPVSPISVRLQDAKIVEGPVSVVITPNAGSALTFSFPDPLTRWVINHNLGYYVGVKIFSLGGLEVDADTQCMNLNQVRVRFEQPFAGFARVF